MWHWDQGRLAYFQFDTLKILSKFALKNDFKSISQQEAHFGTGLPFLPENYKPWRNYSRVLKLSLLITERDGVAFPTPVAHLLSQIGAITCDEYIHFLVQTFTEPSPALKDWSPNANFRFPLVFSLRYILTKLIVLENNMSSLNEIIGAYIDSNFTGEESDIDFIALVNKGIDFHKIGTSFGSQARQARESLKVISQISYLHYMGNSIIVSLDTIDAQDIFHEIEPLQDIPSNEPNEEIFRISNLFKGGSTLDFFDYKNTVITNVIDSGFTEGAKVKKTHVTIERNSKLRKVFFEQNPTAICDVCSLNTKKYYPWTDRVLDLHHLLPLSSGTRVESRGTILDDLVPICPTCHRAVHRYYDIWLKDNSRIDFEGYNEAKNVYEKVKISLGGGQNA